MWDLREHMLMIFKFLALVMGVAILASAAGFGFYLLSARRLRATGLSRLGLCIAFGCGAMGCSATYVFYLGLDPMWTVVLAIGLSLLSSAGAALADFEQFSENALGILRGAAKEADLLFASLILLPLVFRAGYVGGFSQPYRIGIDQVGYGITADYLQRGGTRQNLNSAIKASTQQSTLENAYNANISALSFNESIASEFLLKAHRIGYPMVLASIGRLLRLGNIMDYQFCILAVPWLAGLFSMLWFASDVVGASRFLSKAIAVGYALNCNLLNVLFEGQHAQVFTAPLFILFFGTLLLVRGNRTSKPDWSLLLPVAFVGSSIFALYSDSFLALAFSGFILIGLDFLWLDWRSVQRTLVFPIGVVCGMVALGGYFTEWFGFIVRHISNVSGGHGGASQPYWAFPAEILGYSSIYNQTSVQLLTRTSGDLFVQWTLLFVLASILIVSARSLDAPTWRFWAAPIFVCVYVFVQFKYVHRYHNYSYMKTYTMLAGSIVMVHYATLRTALGRITSKVYARFATPDTITACLALFVGLAGMHEVFHFVRSSEHLPKSVNELRSFDDKNDLGSYAIVTYPEGGIECATLGGYFHFNWLNISWSDKRLAPNLSKKVAVLVLRSSYPLFDRLRQSRGAMFSNDDFVILDTGVTLDALELPDVNITANKPTNEIAWPQKQGPKISTFLEAFLTKLSLK